MNRFYVPYCQGRPSVIHVNGHRLIVLFVECDSAEDSLLTLGADSVERIETVDESGAHDKLIASLGQEMDSDVVIAPPEVGIEDVVRELQMELPWIH